MAAQTNIITCVLSLAVRFCLQLLFAIIQWLVSLIVKEDMITYNCTTAFGEWTCFSEKWSNRAKSGKHRCGSTVGIKAAQSLPFSSSQSLFFLTVQADLKSDKMQLSSFWPAASMRLEPNLIRQDGVSGVMKWTLASIGAINEMCWFWKHIQMQRTRTSRLVSIAAGLWYCNVQFTALPKWFYPDTCHQCMFGDDFGRVTPIFSETPRNLISSCPTFTEVGIYSARNRKSASFAVRDIRRPTIDVKCDAEHDASLYFEIKQKLSRYSRFRVFCEAAHQRLAHYSGRLIRFPNKAAEV